MGTRCGDIDPAIPGWLIREAGMGPDEVDEILNTRSGLLGLSGRSPDMAELLAAEETGDDAAALAIDVFCYRARKQIGAYLAVLGGADAVVFGGGIGERSPQIRARVCADMAWCGIELDDDHNRAAVAVEAEISTARAATAVWIIPVDEATVIARDAAACLEAAAPRAR